MWNILIILVQGPFLYRHQILMYLKTVPAERVKVYSLYTLYLVLIYYLAYLVLIMLIM